MEEEKYTLHDWDRKNIFVKQKEFSVAQLVSETILALRCHLIEKRVAELQQTTLNTNDGNHETLEEIMNYHQLKKLLSKKLNRVLS